MDFREILYLHLRRRDFPNLVKIGEKLGPFTRIPKYLGIGIAARQKCKGNPLLHLHGTPEPFYILDCYMHVTNNTRYCIVVFSRQNGKANAPPFYVIRTLPICYLLDRFV
jgi:hypothetical protein